MAFSLSGSASGGGGAGAEASSGPDLETIQTETVGFLSVAGDAKVRLTSAWTTLPSPTSSLLSIASRSGLVAAAGPDHITFATTESVRKTFEAPKTDDSDIRNFEPQLKISMPMRVSQLAFTADEKYLILSAESGGGLAVYDVQSLLQGSSASAFELSTNGESLRSLAPNPDIDTAHLCAFVTTNGDLYMADLNSRALSNVLKNQVSCVSWSAKGKQLCAGLADGIIYQMTPQGEGKAEIPRPPALSSCHVTSLTWLKNNEFLAIYTDSASSSTAYQLITRNTPTSFTFQKLADPVEPYGSDKAPYHSILRIRDFKPALNELLIVSSTASLDLGLLSRSSKPLANDKPAESITNVFTTTELLDDTKRATLPMTDSMEDSTPIGVGLDLSSKDKVYKPIPSDEELEESPTPLPGLWVLTHEGILCSWWLVYTDSIKEGTVYSKLAVAGGGASSTSTQTAPATTSSPFSSANGPSAFGSSKPSAAPSFGTSSQLGQNASPWGSAASTSTPSNTSRATFGSSTFGSTPASGTPAFGKAGGGAFGQASQLGARTSPWAAGGTVSSNTPAFGQSGFSSFANAGNNQNAFATAGANSNSSTAPASGGFSAFAKSGGFASISNSNATSGSVFGSGSQPATSPFGSASDKNPSTLGSPFSSKKDNASSSVFGSPSTPFKLQSSFKPDPSQAESVTKSVSGPSMFGTGFGSALEDAGNKQGASTPSAKDEEMDASDTTQDTPQAQHQPTFARQKTPESTTPTTTPAPSRFGFTTSSTPGTSLFGQPTKLGGPSTSGIFGSKTGASMSTGFSGLFSQSKDALSSNTQQSPEPETPRIKVEEGEEAPLPPDTTSKVSYPLGDSSSSSAASNAPTQPFGATTTPSKPDAPLPPDFNSTTPKPAPKAAENAPLSSEYTKNVQSVEPDAPLPPDPTSIQASSSLDDVPLPPDFVLPTAPSKETSQIPTVPEETEESDLEEGNVSEGSGVDVAKDLSPSTSGLGPTPGFTPQSSFGGAAGSSFATVQGDQDRSRPLFGEVSRNAPRFPRPNAADSPRSPSPVRGAIPGRVIRSDATRSVSAPGMASQILGPKASHSHLGNSIVGRERPANAEDQFIQQHRKMKERQEAEEAQPLVDQEDDEVQKVLASDVEGTLELDEFIAHSNITAPAKESIPAQVEAVYRDVNSMIDTLGLNSRAVKAFTKGHTDKRQEEGRTKEDLEIPDDWVLCEVSELGDVLDNELYGDLENGRVQDLDDKLDECRDLSRDMQRLRAKQEDLKRVITARMDPDQADLARTLPLSAEQASQQNELRREFANFSKLLAEAEEALTLLKTRIAAASSSSGRGGGGNVPTVEAVMRTISKMTSMVEKRSGDIDMLESQMRKVRLESRSREGSPMVTPQAKRTAMMSPDSTPSRNFRHSLTSSVMSLGASARATPPRKKLSGFSSEEKGDLMEKKARRQGVLAKLKSSVEKRGVNVWNMEDIE